MPANSNPVYKGSKWGGVPWWTLFLYFITKESIIYIGRSVWGTYSPPLRGKNGKSQKDWTVKGGGVG